MKKKLLALAILPFIAISSLPSSASAAEAPACSSEMNRYFEYEGYHVKEHKWYCVYNSDFYTVKFYSEDSRLLGWQIFKNYQLISTRDFISNPDTQAPLCSSEMNRYFEYEGYHVKEHKWYCVYDNDFYTIKVYSEGNLLLGWQIFQNKQIVSSMRFI